MRHASALKAKRQNIARKNQNFQVRNRVRTLSNNVLEALGDKNVDSAKKQFQLAQSALQKAAKKRILHPNAASRHISRLASRVALASKN